MLNRVWQNIEQLSVAFVDEVVTRVNHYGRAQKSNLRWRLEGSNRAVLSVRDEYLVNDAVYSELFHLSSFKQLKQGLLSVPAIAALASPGPELLHGLRLNVEDFAVRLINASVGYDLNGELKVDVAAALSQLNALFELAEAQDCDVLLVVMLRGPTIWPASSLTLDEKSSLRRLEDNEFLSIAQRGFILPRPRYDKFNALPAQVVEIRESERVVLSRRLTSAFVLRENSLGRTMQQIAAEEIGRLADAFAIAQGRHIETTAWYAKSASTLANTETWQSVNPLTPDPIYSVDQFEISEAVAELWKLLLKGSTSPDGSAVRLGARRVGLAVARTNIEDKLVDATIAIEALVDIGLDDRNKAAEAGLRASLLCGATIAGVEGRVKKAVEKAYNIRNKIVHGKLSEARVAELAATEAVAIARELASRQLSKGASSGKFETNWTALKELQAARSRDLDSESVSVSDVL